MLRYNVVLGTLYVKCLSNQQGGNKFYVYGIGTYLWKCLSAPLLKLKDVRQTKCISE